MESEWTVFKTSIVEACDRSCGRKVSSRQAEEGGLSGLVGPGVSWSSRHTGRPEGLQLRWARMRKLEHGRSSGRPWRRTFGRPQRGSGKPSGGSGRESRAYPRLFSAWGGGGLLTRTVNIAGRWKEHFEELLNPANMSPLEGAVPIDLAGVTPISLAEAAKVVKKLLGGKAPGMVDIRPEMLKALDIVGLSWLTRLFNVAWGSGTVPMNWQTRVVVPKRGARECAWTIVVSHYSASRGKLMPGCWKGGSDRWSNLRFKTSSADSVPVVELWTSSLPSQDYWRGPGCFVDLEKAFDRVL